MLQGYKFIIYENIPKDFNQTTHYVEQTKPIDKGDHIKIGIKINELDLEDEEFDEDSL